MKKLLALLLVLASVFCLASCLGGETPEQPDDPSDEPTGELFVYSEVQGGYAISGLTDEGKTAKTLTIPTEYNGEKVIVIAANAFSGAAVEKLVLTEDTNVGKFENNAVAGASKLSANFFTAFFISSEKSKYQFTVSKIYFLLNSTLVSSALCKLCNRSAHFTANAI